MHICNSQEGCNLYIAEAIYYSVAYGVEPVYSSVYCWRGIYISPTQTDLSPLLLCNCPQGHLNTDTHTHTHKDIHTQGIMSSQAIICGQITLISVQSYQGHWDIHTDRYTHTQTHWAYINICLKTQEHSHSHMHTHTCIVYSIYSKCGVFFLNVYTCGCVACDTSV